MASTKERAWLAAHQKGSKALIQKLDKAHANNPEYQAFKKKHGLGDTSSVKQVSKSQVDAKKEKARQALAAKAYGATRGTRMGGEDGRGEEIRDTTVPLSPEQHSKVKAAERAAKPVKEKKPRAKKAPTENKPVDRLALLKQIASKKKINNPPVSHKQLRTIAAVGGQEHDHGGWDDLAGTGFEGRSGRNIDESQTKALQGTPVVSLDDVSKPSDYKKDKYGRRVPKKLAANDPRVKFHKEKAKQVDEEINNRITKIHVRGQNVIVHRYDTEAKGTYKRVIHHSSPSAAQQYARKLHKGSMSKPELVISEEVWDNPNPKKTSKALSASQKARAKARARAAGRSYPNLVDNMWASKLSEGMIDDFVASKIQAYHGNKVKGSVEQADKARTDLTAKLAPVKRKIERIKARASYKDKSHARHDETKLDLKHAKAEHDSIASERTKHYDAFKKAKAERDTNIASDMQTYNKFGLVGLGLKRLKQKLGESYDKAEEHKNKASKALETSDTEAYHKHMANHHEELGKWHESKGRGDAAQKHFDKAEQHHEKGVKMATTLKGSRQMKEGILSKLLGRKPVQKPKTTPAQKSTGYQGLPKEWSQEKRGNEYDANKQMEEEMKVSKDAPFAGPYRKKSAMTTDKSGAKHTGTSKARDLARQALKKVMQKEEVKPDATNAMSDTMKKKHISDKDKATLSKIHALMKAQKKPMNESMKYGIGSVIKLKKPIDGHEYATVRGLTGSSVTRGPTGRGTPMPAGNVTKVKVALRKSDDHSYYNGAITHIKHDDIHSVIRRQ